MIFDLYVLGIWKFELKRFESFFKPAKLAVIQ